MTKQTQNRLGDFSLDELQMLKVAQRGHISAAENTGDLLLSKNLVSDLNIINEMIEMKSGAQKRVKPSRPRPKKTGEPIFNPNLLKELERAGKIWRFRLCAKTGRYERC